MRVDDCPGGSINFPNLGDGTIAMVQIDFRTRSHAGTVNVQTGSVDIDYRSSAVTGTGQLI